MIKNIKRFILSINLAIFMVICVLMAYNWNNIADIIYLDNEPVKDWLNRLIKDDTGIALYIMKSLKISENETSVLFSFLLLIIPTLITFMYIIKPLIGLIVASAISLKISKSFWNFYMDKDMIFSFPFLKIKKSKAEPPEPVLENIDSQETSGWWDMMPSPGTIVGVFIGCLILGILIAIAKDAMNIDPAKELFTESACIHQTTNNISKSISSNQQNIVDITEMNTEISKELWTLSEHQTAVLVKLCEFYTVLFAEIDIEDIKHLKGQVQANEENIARLFAWISETCDNLENARNNPRDF